jgi:hypothetical protein
VPDDVGGRRQISPTRTTPESEPPDPTWLYENEPLCERPERARTEAWRVAPSREKPDETERPGARDEPPQPEDDAEGRERRRRRRLLVAAIGGALLLIAAIGFGWYWFTELRWLESTDDAYTQADTTIISPKVAG